MAERSQTEQVLRGWFPTWEAALGYLSGTLGKQTSRVIAQHTGRHMRSVQRWTKALREGRPVKMNAAVADSLRALAASRKVLNSAGRVQAGWVKVAYEGKPQGRRNIGTVQITPVDMSGVAGLLAAGRWAEAAEELDRAVLDAYGDDLGDSLTITDYEGGMDIS